MNNLKIRMPLTTRSHAITFRLGDQEYDQLVKTVANKGARSLSEFTRMAVLNQILADNLDHFVKEEIDALMSTLDAFDSKIRDLRRQIRQLTTKSESYTN